MRNHQIFFLLFILFSSVFCDESKEEAKVVEIEVTDENNLNGIWRDDSSFFIICEKDNQLHAQYDDAGRFIGDRLPTENSWKGLWWEAGDIFGSFSAEKKNNDELEITFFNSPFRGEVRERLTLHRAPKEELELFNMTTSCDLFERGEKLPGYYMYPGVYLAICNVDSSVFGTIYDYEWKKVYGYFVGHSFDNLQSATIKWYNIEEEVEWGIAFIYVNTPYTIMSSEWSTRYPSDNYKSAELIEKNRPSARFIDMESLEQCWRGLETIHLSASPVRHPPEKSFYDIFDGDQEPSIMDRFIQQFIGKKTEEETCEGEECTKKKR